MTREEAIYRLKNTAWLGTDKDREETEQAVDMAIEALSVANLKEGFESADAEQKSDAYKRGFDDCKRAYEIELTRSADAVQGEWISETDAGTWMLKCSVCGCRVQEEKFRIAVAENATDNT